MGLIQHTNFINKKHYGNNHLLYVANYYEQNNQILKMSVDAVTDYFLPYLKKINSEFLSAGKQGSIFNSKFYFTHPFAQPLYNREFLNNRPEMITPSKNFYLANLEMTYPYDRGTNFAVKLGKQVAGLIDKII